MAKCGRGSKSPRLLKRRECRPRIRTKSSITSNKHIKHPSGSKKSSSLQSLHDGREDQQ